MTRACGMADAVKKRDAEQRPGGAAVGLGGANGAGHHAVELGLLVEDVAGKSADLAAIGARNAEGLRHCGIERPAGKRQTGDEHNKCQHSGAAAGHIKNSPARAAPAVVRTLTGSSPESCWRTRRRKPSS